MKMVATAPTFSVTKCYSNKGSNVIDRVILVLIALLILLSPLPFGSVEQSAIFGIETVAAVCFLLWLLKLFLFGNQKALAIFRSQHQDQKVLLRRTPYFHRHPGLANFFRFVTFGKWPRKNPSFDILSDDAEAVPALSFSYYSLFGYPVRRTGVEGIALVFFAVLVLQLLVIPGFAVKFVSPNTYRLYHSAAAAVGIPLSSPSLSLNWFVTFSKLLQYAAYFMIYLVTVNVARSRPFFITIIYAVIVSALFQSIYGLYELFSGNQEIFGYKKIYFLNSASGSFINRNHYAVYVGLSLPLLMSLIAAKFLHVNSGQGNPLIRLIRALDHNKGKIVLPFYFSTVILLGIAFSLSLTGMIPVLIGSAVFIFLYGRLRASRRIYWITALLLLMTLAGGWLSSDTLRRRIEGIPGEVISERSRFLAWKDTVRMFLHFPVIGTGSGTFREVFPNYRQFGTDSIYSETHNEYLQQLSENGVVMILILAVSAHLAAARMRRITSNPVARLTMFQVGAFCSLLILALHNLIDFSFQIPAIAVAGVILAGLFFGNYRTENTRNGAA